MLDVILREYLPIALMAGRGVDEAGVLLVRKMMSIDASSRPTARQCLEYEWLKAISNNLETSPSAINVTTKRLDTVIEEQERSKSSEYALRASKSFERASAGHLDAPLKTQSFQPQQIDKDDDEWPRPDASSQWELRDLADTGTPSSDDEPIDIAAPKDDMSSGSSLRKLVHRGARDHRLAYSDGGVRLADLDSSYGTSEDDKSVLPEQAYLTTSKDVIAHQKRHSLRLFGEVTASTIEESGVFGGVPLRPTILPTMPTINQASQATPVSPSVSFSANKRIREDDLSSAGDEGLLQERDNDAGPPYKRSMLNREYSGSVETSSSVEVTTREVKDRMSKLHFPLGTLTPTAGSFSNTTLKIYDRGMTFGRCLELTHVYPSDKDTRVPRLAIDIIFWRAGVTKDIEQGLQWQSLPGVNAMVLTRSKAGIKVNGVKLNKASEETAFNCGRLRTGDIIEVFNGGGAFLRYRCSFFVGESSAERKPTEKFVVEQNSKLFQEVISAKMAADKPTVAGSKIIDRTA